ncbi:hypothetical protein MMC13_007651 [Lambiella insularis]|nr:hypothetical protein [Lambiella insularis]
MSSFDSYSTVKTLFVLGTTTAAFCSGGLLFTSYMHMPAYLQNPSDDSLVTQWRTQFDRGKFGVPPLALIAGGANLLNSYLTRTQPQHYRFMAAGALSLAIVPFTLVALGSTNAELHARVEKREGSTDKRLRNLSAKELVQRWSNRSAVRGLFFLASTILSCDAMLHLTF